LAEVIIIKIIEFFYIAIRSQLRLSDGRGAVELPSNQSRFNVVTTVLPVLRTGFLVL